MAKVVYNVCNGGFGLSPQAIQRYYELTGKHLEENPKTIPRHDHILVRVYEELGDEVASAPGALLDIREIPDGSKYRIEDHDGYEKIVLIDEYDWIVAI